MRGAGASVSGARLAEPLWYVAFLLLVVIGASNVLQKAGVPLEILTRASMAVLAGTALLPALFLYAPGLDAFGRLSPPLRGPLSAIPLLIAMLPGGLMLAFLAAGPAPEAMAALGAAFAALILSSLYRHAARGLSGPFDLAGFIARTYASNFLPTAAVVVVALPLLALLCGQAAAFGALAQSSLGIAYGPAILLCLTMATLQIGLSGVRGLIAGGGALLIAFLASAFAALFLPEQIPMLISVDGGADLRSVMRLALPFIPFEPLQFLSGNPALLAFSALVLGAAQGLLPVFALHARPSPDRSLHRSGATLQAALLLVILAGIFHIAVLAENGGLKMLLSLPDQWQDEAAIAMTDRIILLALLMSLALAAASLLLTLSLLLASLIHRDGRGYLPARQLAVARISVLLLALLASWLAMGQAQSIPDIAQLVLSLAAAFLLPLLLAAPFARHLPPRVGEMIAGAGILAAAACHLLSAEQLLDLPVDPMIVAICSGLAASTLSVALLGAYRSLASRKGTNHVGRAAAAGAEAGSGG